jgi:hypothetical protein
MDEPFKILTQRKKGESHRETLVTIDWDGVSEDQLRTLARRALVYNFQCSIKKDPTGPFPETVTLVARNAAEDHTPVMEIIFAPQVPKVKAAKDLDWEDMFVKLSPAELKELQALLETQQDD